MTRDEPAGEIADRNARLADYILDQMNAAEAAQFERDMQLDPILAREVSDLRERLLELDAGVGSLPASDTLWNRIAADIAQRHPIGATEGARVDKGGGRRHGIWSSLAFWRAIAVAASAAVILLAAGLAFVVERSNSEPVYVAVLVNEADLTAGAIVEIDREGLARLITLEDIPVPSGRALQIWTLQDQEAGPQSIGLIREARSITLDIGELPPTQADQLFEITLEPESGSPTGRPTGPVLFKGTTSPTL